jgi:hypothetical protein
MISLRELLGDYDRAFKGQSVAGFPMLTVVDNFRVFEGNLVRDAVPLYTLVGNKLFKGLAVSGRPLATLSGDRIFLGTSVAGYPLARIKGNLVFKGGDVMGKPIATVPSGNRNALLAAAYHALQR